MDLDPERLHVIGPVRSPREVRQVELDLVPALVQSHGHRADERLDPGGGLVIARPESSPHIFVIQDLYLECVIFLHVLDNHHEVGKLDAECLLRVGGASDVGGGNVGANNFQNKTLNVLICDSFDVPISDLKF